MKEYTIGFSDGFSYGDTLIKYEIAETENGGELRLYVEDCARALGVTQTRKLSDDSLSTTLRWERVHDDLMGIERIPNVGTYKNMSTQEKKEARKSMSSMTISETELYLWSFRVDGLQGREFRNWLATTVLPYLRKYGIYVNGLEDMTASEAEIAIDQAKENFVLRKFGIGIRNDFTQTIKDYVKPNSNESYKYGMYTNVAYGVVFGMTCKEYKDMKDLEKKDSMRDSIRDSDEFEKLDDIAKVEDKMGDLMMMGIIEEKQLTSMLKAWYEGFRAKRLTV